MTRAAPAWKTQRVSHIPTVPTAAAQTANRLCCPTLGDSHYDWYNDGGQINCDIPVIISNHPDNAALANFYGVGYEVVESCNGDKRKSEEKILMVLERYHPDLLVLARYMQVLSQGFVSAYRHRIINIHHSFLPAFIGGKPYHRAFERGVKLIGATSHYVTDVLDDGPIIEQDVVRISHRDTVEDLIRKGRDLERVVLARAVRWHLENRILLYGNKTVVFV